MKSSWLFVNYTELERQLFLIIHSIDIMVYINHVNLQIIIKINNLLSNCEIVDINNKGDFNSPDSSICRKMSTSQTCPLSKAKVPSFKSTASCRWITHLKAAKSRQLNSKTSCVIPTSKWSSTTTWMFSSVSTAVENPQFSQPWLLVWAAKRAAHRAAQI